MGCMASDVGCHGELRKAVEVSVGSDDMVYLTDDFNVPIKDGLYAKFGVTSRNRDGYVYVIRQTGSDFVKIGCSENVDMRVSQLQIANPYTLVIELTHRDQDM